MYCEQKKVLKKKKKKLEKNIEKKLNICYTNFFSND